MTTKAAPVSVGRSRNNSLSWSRPPAEAPRATTGPGIDGERAGLDVSVMAHLRAGVTLMSSRQFRMVAVNRKQDNDKKMAPEGAKKPVPEGEPGTAVGRY